MSFDVGRKGGGSRVWHLHLVADAAGALGIPPDSQVPLSFLPVSQVRRGHLAITSEPTSPCQDVKAEMQSGKVCVLG